MDRKMLYFVEEQPMSPEKPIERGDRKIAQMLMVDGVELAVFGQSPDIGRLDDADAVRLENKREGLDEAVGVGDVGQNIIRMDDIRPHAFVTQSLRKIAREECAARRHADLLGGRRGPGRGIDPEHGYPSLDVIF